MVESSSDDILAGADTDDVAFLVVGDPFGYGLDTMADMTISYSQFLVLPLIRIYFCELGS